ncbi:Uncharacterised protein [Mycobacteroides abscessus]|nr:Uncharacterised protein [Mycobacteroides abscessus]
MPATALSGRVMRLDRLTRRAPKDWVMRASTPGPVTTGVTASIVRHVVSPVLRARPSAAAASARGASTRNRVRAPAKSSTARSTVSRP